MKENPDRETNERGYIRNAKVGKKDLIEMKYRQGFGQFNVE